jgi:hypothetical protein
MCRSTAFIEIGVTRGHDDDMSQQEYDEANPTPVQKAEDEGLATAEQRQQVDTRSAAVMVIAVVANRGPWWSWGGGRESRVNGCKAGKWWWW